MKGTILHAMFFIGIITTAYAQTPGLGNYIPYHQIFAQNAKMLIGNNEIAHSRSAIYREVAMRHDRYISNAFVFNDSINFFYKSVGLLDLALDSSNGKVYDTTNMQWLPNNRTLYTSSADGTFDTIRQQAWQSGSLTWVDSIVTYYTYNSNFLLLTKSFTESTNTGSLTVNDTNYLNAAGTSDSISIVDSSTNNPSFVGYKTSYNYGVDGKLLSTVYYSFQNLHYVPLTSSGYTYNASGLTASISDSVWIPAGNGFLFVGNSSYNYNSSGSLLAEIDSTQDSLLTPALETIYNYNTSNNDTMVIVSQFDTSLHKWIPLLQYNYAYDANNNVIYEEDEAFSYDISNNTLQIFPNDQYFYYYEAFTEHLGINNVSNGTGIKVYPNPTSNAGCVVNFTLESQAEMDLLVYDITGKTVITLNGSYNSGINTLHFPTGQLASGLYTIKMVNRTDGSSNIAKLVKE